jgi:hypothetical protein
MWPRFPLFIVIASAAIVVAALYITYRLVDPLPPRHFAIAAGMVLDVAIEMLSCLFLIKSRRCLWRIYWPSVQSNENWFLHKFPHQYQIRQGFDRSQFFAWSCAEGQPQCQCP